jgi:hypothetical protein
MRSIRFSQGSGSKDQPLITPAQLQRRVAIKPISVMQLAPLKSSGFSL